MGKYRTLAQAMAAAEAYCNVPPAQAGNDQSTKAPMMVSGDKGSRDQGIKGNISFQTDQGVFDSTDEVFLDKYGDIMGVVNGHPLCVKAIETWGAVWPQGMTNAMKDLGVSPVIEALRYTANYKAAIARDKFFWKQIKNLREGKPLGYRGV